MAKTLRVVSFLFVLTFLAACQTAGSRKLEAVPSRIQPGKTTKPEVIAALGEPDRRQVVPGGETWFYGGQRSAGGGALDSAIGVGSAFIPVPYVGTAINGVRSLGRSDPSAQPSAAIEFDARGVVRDYVVDIPE